jgi:hypothetical protein
MTPQARSMAGRSRAMASSAPALSSGSHARIIRCENRAAESASPAQKLSAVGAETARLKTSKVSVRQRRCAAAPTAAKARGEPNRLFASVCSHAACAHACSGPTSESTSRSSATLAEGPASVTASTARRSGACT